MSGLADGLVRNEDGVVRCWWGGGDHPDYRVYHDEEWGMPVSDDRRLFEKLCLEGFQSGLSWLTILRKREGFRRAFADFDPVVVAGYGAREIEQLLEDASIVRHRGKIEASINNARRLLELLETEGSLLAYVRRFEPAPADRPAEITHEWLMLQGADGGLASAGKGSEATRVGVRRPDDRLCVHAGDGSRQRSPHRL